MTLQESVKMYGIIVPLVVDRMKNGRYKLIDGQQRLDCITVDGFVPCIVRGEKGTIDIPKRLIQCQRQKN